MALAAGTAAAAASDASMDGVTNEQVLETGDGSVGLDVKYVSDIIGEECTGLGV